MARFDHKVLTVQASAKTLAELAGITANGPDDIPYRMLSFQAGPANAGIVYLGGPGVSAAAYGWYLAVPSSSVPDPPQGFGTGFAGGGSVKLSEVYVIGTANDKLHLLLIAL